MLGNHDYELMNEGSRKETHVARRVPMRAQNFCGALGFEAAATGGFGGAKLDAATIAAGAITACRFVYLAIAGSRFCILTSALSP